MARAASVSDSGEDTRVVSKSKADAAENGSGEEEGDEGSEYEIEEVLDAKRGYFPDGHMGYFVKWKGYDGPNDNSWVDEYDAENAGDLVEEFWRKNPTRKRPAGRKSVDKKSPAKSRKSAAADESFDAGESKSKKRGRKSAASQKMESEGEMDAEQSEAPVPKKAKKNATQSSKAAKTAKTTKATKGRTETPEDEEKDEKIIGDMSNYMHLSTWEGVVKTVDTVERATNDTLIVYFTLNTGESVKEDSRICKDKFPQMLLDFYEMNLRWRTIDDES